MINVWQTLDLIAGSDLKRRIDGYQDVNAMFKVMTKRDSFTTNLQSANTEQQHQQQARHVSKVSKEDSTLFGGTDEGINNAPITLSASSTKKLGAGKKTKGHPGRSGKGKKKYYIYGEQHSNKNKSKPNEEETLPKDYDAVIDCSYNLPRISARLEKLMGTNVVRLTDRKYMKRLRERLLEDYIQTLDKRITERELKELARERNLILEGKTDIIPEELANHPIFIVNKRVNKLIAKRRSKLKTLREKNAEKLLRRGAKWERDRLIYEELQQKKDDEIKKIKKEQKALERKYTKENNKNGMNLLRMHDMEFKKCEMDLKDFLERERARMKARSLRKPVYHSNDPLDIMNIVRKRQTFRETERKIRQELEKSDIKELDSKTLLARSQVASEASRQLAEDQIKPVETHGHFIGSQDTEDPQDLSLVEMSAPVRKLSQTESAYIAKIVATMDDDIIKGFLVSKAQFNELIYSDPNVAKLKKAHNIRELYLLAEEIITGEPILLYGEEFGEEEGFGEMFEDDDDEVEAEDY